MKVHVGGSCNYKLEKFLKPELVYIPLEDKFGNQYKHLVKAGDYIYKGMVVAISNEGHNIYSSVSGYALIGSTKYINTGKKVKCIVIENDFKEKCEKSRIVISKKYTKEDFIQNLKEFGITDLYENAYGTYLSYKQNDIKYLVVNGIECESYICSDKAIMINYTEQILEGIDKILEIMDIKKCFIVVGTGSHKVIDTFNKYIKAYPNINLTMVDGIYPVVNERWLIKKIFNTTYDKHSYEKGIIINDVSTIYAIYEMIKFDRPLTERIITISGPGIKNKITVKVKIGSLLSEVINNLSQYKNIKNPLLIAGNLMTGKSISSDDLIITKDLKDVHVIKDKYEKTMPCINCGKCLEVCPVKISPVHIMKNTSMKYLKKLDPNRCIECGLCSYICPSKIEVREFVKKAKDMVNNK